MSTPHPGQILKEKFLDPLGISMYRLSQAIGVHVSRISQLVQGKRSVSPDTAMRLGLYFGVPARWWMDMQTSYDLDNQAQLASLTELVVPLERPAGVAFGPSGVRRFQVVHDTKQQSTESKVDDRLLELLMSQTSHSPKATEREVEVKDFGNGYSGVAGRKS